MTDSSHHAATPQICAGCAATMREGIARAADQDVLSHCPHHATLIYAQVRGGLVRHWVFDGPVSAEQAAAAAEHHARLLDASGLLAPQPVRSAH